MQGGAYQTPVPTGSEAASVLAALYPAGYQGASSITGLSLGVFTPSSSTN